MRWFRLCALALASTGLLFGCGGSDDPPAPAQIKYTKMVVFGDSLSDVGSYATPGLVAATGGGKYTVNGPGALNWTERVATAAGVPALCAAQTGLNSVGPFAGFAAPVTNHAGCTSYAQGGSRVTNPVGVGNVATLPGQSSGALGQLTVPVITQIQTHLAAAGGSFSGTDLVMVFAGGNDYFVQVGTVAATAAAGGNATAAGQAATAAMGQAGGELAAYVKSLIVGKGAKRVVVVGMPDASLALEVIATPLRDVVQLMSFTFNAQLQYGLQGVPDVLYVDGYTWLQSIAANPGAHGVSNMTAPACNAALAPAVLFCSTATTVSGDVSKYFWADSSGHSTPYGNELLAKFVVDTMKAAGWL